MYHSARAGIKISLYNEKYKILTDIEILAKLEVDASQIDDAVRDNII